MIIQCPHCRTWNRSSRSACRECARKLAPGPYEETRPCIECGMRIAADEYHPYGVCLMFKGCYNSELVRSNLLEIQNRSYVMGQQARDDHN